MFFYNIYFPQRLQKLFIVFPLERAALFRSFATDTKWKERRHENT